jgi:hypothetical protein
MSTPGGLLENSVRSVYNTHIPPHVQARKLPLPSRQELIHLSKTLIHVPYIPSIAWLKNYKRDVSAPFPPVK